MTKKNLFGVFLVSITLFFLELGIMLALQFFQASNLWLNALLDALFVTALATLFVQGFHLRRWITLPGTKKVRASGWRAFFSGTTVIGAKFAFSIFFAESVIMLLLPPLTREPTWLVPVLDATLLALLCGPVSYFWLSNTLKPPQQFAHLTQSQRGTFFVVFTPSMIIVTFVVLSFSHTEVTQRQNSMELHTAHNLTMIQNGLSNYVNARIFDLIRLSQHLPLRAFLAGEPWAKKSILSEYAYLLKQTPHYAQIRLIDPNGQEVIRVDRDADPIFVPEARLQNKKHRYYFKEALALKEGTVYVSALDLNMEHARIELPHKPVVRMAAPIFDNQKNTRGILVINVYGDQLMDIVGHSDRYTPQERLTLLDREGYWLYGAPEGPPEERLFGFHFPDKKHLRFGNQFPPIWSAMENRPSGQVRTARGLFTFTTFQPGGHQGKPPYIIQAPTWKLVSWIPDTRKDHAPSGLYGKYALLLLCLALFLGVVSWNLSVAIFKRREAQKALEHHAEELEVIVMTRTKQLAHAERLASLGTFAAGMAHEINNPNAFISGNIAFIKQFWSLAFPLLKKHQAEEPSGRLGRVLEEVENSLDDMLDGSARISVIVDSLKTYSKGGMESDKVECRLAEPVRDAEKLLGHRLKQGTELVVQVSDDIVVVCDRQQMSQIFVNLFNNAMDAMEGAGHLQHKRITVLAQAQDSHVWIWVKDSGPGISDEVAGKVFDPFYTSKGKTKGTGLGLSIVHGIVQDHAGQITVFSSPDPEEETEFLIILPNRETYQNIVKERKKAARRGRA